MNIGDLVLSVFAGSVSVGIIYSVASLVGASYYDIIRIRAERWRKYNPYRKWSRYRPLLSVIIPAHNEETVIERCIDSIVKSSCRKFEIIIVDDASTDNTPRVVRKLIAKYPRRTIKLMVKRKNVGRGGAINAGFKNYAQGDLIMALDADCIIDKYALRNTARHFYGGKITAMAANIRIMNYPGLLSLIQQYEYLVGFRSKKFNTIANSEYIVGGAGATYTREIFTKLKGFNEAMLTEDIAMSLAIARLGNKKHRLVYATDVLIYTEPVPTYKGLLKQRYRWKIGALQALYAHKELVFAKHRRYSKTLAWMRLPLAIWSEVLLLLEPLLFTYFFYLAIIFQNPLLFVSACLTLTGMLLITILGDEYFPIITKLKMSFISPIMYILLFVMTSIQVIAAFRCILNYKQVRGDRKIRGAWKPPERLGTTA